MKAEIDKYVIKQVKERRIKLGFSQEALSYAINCNESFIGTFESGKNTYNLKQLNEIAIVLKCSIKDFIPDKPIQ